MSKKAKTEVVDESAVFITDAVLAENDKKLKDLSASIQNALKRKHKIIMDCKLYTYDKLSELYGGAEGQALLDAVTAEHTLISKLTASGMTYEQIGELADDSSADAGNSSDDDVADDEFVGQTSFFGDNSYKD